MEKQKLIYVESKALFSPSEVSDKAIVFIKDTKEIWTHGVYFSCSGTWASPITLSLTGDTTGSVSIDGSGNASITTTTKYLSGTTAITDANNAANTRYHNIAYYPLVVSGSSNLFPVGNNANAILSLNVHDYSYTHLLGFSSNGNIYHRRRNGGTWETTWKTILNSSNYTNFPHTFASLTNKPTTLSGYGITDCIPIIKGGLVTTDTDLSTLGMTTYGAKLSVFHLFEGPYPTWLNVPYMNVLMFRSTSDSYGAIGIELNGSHTVLFIGGRNPETTANNVPNWWFRIKGNSETTYDLNSILNTINNLGSNYLRKSGGTMTGALNFANNTWNKVGDDAYMGDCNVGGMIGIKSANRVTPGFALFNDAGTQLGKLFASGTNLYWSKGSETVNNIILHTRNYSEYALPLSGGTMTGVITLTSGSGAAYDKNALSFIKSSNKSEQARIGTDTDNGLGMYATGKIYIRPNVTLGSGSTNGLIISNSSFTYNGNAVLTSSNYTNYTINYANKLRNYKGYAGVISDGKLYYNNVLEFAVFAPDDNGGATSYELIAELPNYDTGTNTSYIVYGISGFMWSYRAYGAQNSSSYSITAIVSIGKDTYSRLRVPVTTSVLVPFVVKYNNKYYLALRKLSSETNFYFMGYKKNLLTTTIKVNDASLIEEIKGPEAETSTAKYYYNNGTPQGYLHAGNYSSYAIKVDGTNGTSDGVSTLLNKLTTGTATPVDADYYICQYAGGGTTTTTYHRRPMSALYTYIKSKLSLNPDERFIYATSATSNQYGTTEATGSSSTLTRTLFWRDNDRALIGMYVQHSDNLNYGFELASSYGSDAALSYRRKFDGTWGTIQTILTSSNYNNYSPTLTGTGASGTWAINISGVAASASKVANALTIQLNGGTTAGTNKFVYDGSSAYTINITPAAIGASATSHTHSYLPLAGGALGSNTASFTELFIKSSTAKMRLMAYSDSVNYIQSGNSDFSGNATLKITGYNATTGSNLYFSFANIYCRAGDYTNIDSGNYSSYALPLSGGTMTGTINCKAIVPITDNGYSIGTSSKTLYEIHANFFKRRGSSNDYVLLGGGEHKLISDFVLNYTAVVPGGSVGNNDSWTLILNNNYSTGWYNPCTMFYIRSHNFGCGILCFYHYWNTELTSGYYDNSVWFFGAEHSAYSGTMGGTGRDINNFLKVYIDKDNDNLKIYYNRYNNLGILILELLFSLYLAGTLYPKGLIRASHFITNGAVTDLPITSSTFVNIPILTAKNHTEDIKTTRSVYASSFYENSDIRLKENVRGIDLSDLTKLVDLVQFNFKDGSTKKYGVIAQLLELVGLQNLVYENNGNKAVDYISLLVLEIQRLRNEIGELKLEINKKS